MKEKDLEDIICKYPELIETDLVFIGRQMRLHGKIIDVLFEDKFKQKLIVELKIGPVDRKHIGQVMEYEGNVLSEEDPTARIMLVGNRVPPNFQKALNHHGIEWKEINAKQLCGFVKDKNDLEFLHLFGEQAEAFAELRPPKMAAKQSLKTVAGVDEVNDSRKAFLHRAPRESGITVELDDGTINARSVRDMYKQALMHLVDTGLIMKISLPYATSAKRYLLSRNPVHPAGRPMGLGVLPGMDGNLLRSADISGRQAIRPRV